MVEDFHSRPDAKSINVRSFDRLGRIEESMVRILRNLAVLPPDGVVSLLDRVVKASVICTRAQMGSQVGYVPLGVREERAARKLIAARDNIPPSEIL